VILIDPEHSRIIDVRTGEAKSFQFNLTVNEYIAMHGVRMESGTRFDPEIGKRSSLSFYIGNNLEWIVPFIDAHRDEWNNMGEVKQNCHWKIEEGSQRFVSVMRPTEKDAYPFRLWRTQKTSKFQTIMVIIYSWRLVAGVGFPAGASESSMTTCG
jgi:hypothetical protein